MEDSIIYKGQYFYIVESYIEKRKTPILDILVEDEDGPFLLGEIKWFGAWRKFCFYPSSDTVWDNKCLQELVNFLNDYNKEYRNRSK